MMTEFSGSWYQSSDESERQVFKDWLRGLLRDEIVDIEFTKKDGTPRLMRCTLSEKVVPVYERKTDEERVQNTEALSVFDVEKNDWRSFRYDSIRSINFTLGSTNG